MCAGKNMLSSPHAMTAISEAWPPALTHQLDDNVIQECMSLATIKEHAKQCPDCGMATEKSEGCNKMVCGNCGAYWCWK